MTRRRRHFFRNLWSASRRIPCRWIGCSTANYICNHEKKTAAGRGCPSSRRGPSASTSSHGSSSLSYSLYSTSRTGPRTCFGRRRRTSKCRRGSARIIKERGSRPFPSYSHETSSYASTSTTVPLSTILSLSPTSTSTSASTSG